MKPILADLGLRTLGDERAWAVTSPDDRFRYVLGRMWDDYFDESGHWWEAEPTRPLWVWCMLNPSKARHDVEDPTMRKVRGFTERGGGGGFIIVNMFAYSATDPREMVAAWSNGLNVRGEHNETVLRWAARGPWLLSHRIAAWGKVPRKLSHVAAPSALAFLGAGIQSLGRNKDGSPRHPLMLGYDTKFQPWSLGGHSG